MQTRHERYVGHTFDMNSVFLYLLNMTSDCSIGNINDTDKNDLVCSVIQNVKVLKNP